MDTQTLQGSSIAKQIITIDFNQFKPFIDEVFQDTLTNFIAEESQDDNLLSISFVNNLYIESLTQLRKNKINTYINSEDKIALIINQLVLSNSELKVLNISAFSVKAYYYYKIKDYDNSIHFTNEAIANDDFFLEKHPFLYGHKIQQLHNIIRTYFRSDKIEKACSLNDNILCHLIHGKTIQYQDGIWYPNYNINNDLDMIPMVYQIFTEAIYTITNLSTNKEQEKKLLRLAFEKLTKLKTSTNGELQLLIDWMAIKFALVNNENISDSTIENWISKMVNSKFAAMSKPLFYGLYVTLNNDDYVSNKESFTKTYF